MRSCLFVANQIQSPSSTYLDRYNAFTNDNDVKKSLKVRIKRDTKSQKVSWSRQQKLWDRNRYNQSTLVQMMMIMQINAYYPYKILFSQFKFREEEITMLYTTCSVRNYFRCYTILMFNSSIYTCKLRISSIRT